jgi:AAA family ATPase
MNAFTLRPLERVPPGDMLEGAFRVHLALKDLKEIKVTNGDLVRLSTPEGPKGIAIAWLAVTAKPNNKPIAKVTDLLKAKLGINLNDKVFIDKVVDEDWRPITSIELSLHDPQEDLSGYSSTEDFLFWTRNALGGTVQHFVGF